MTGIYPERIQRPDFGNTRATLEQMYNYIQYMCERTDFALGGINRNVAETKTAVAKLAERFPVTQPIIEDAAPTTATVGLLGQHYVDIINKNVYACVGITTVDDETTYTWKQLNNA